MKINGRNVGAAPMTTGAAPTRSYKAAAQRKIVQAKAIERKRGYTKLECGTKEKPHYSVWAENQVYSFARPDGFEHWCDACGKWRKTPAKARKVYPDEPLF